MSVTVNNMNLIQSEIEVTPINPYRWGDDLDVVNAARVSFNKESNWEVDYTNDPLFGEAVLKQADKKLIKYLADHKHKSPFNHSFISMRIKVPIFVARQLVKHKFLPWNEVSRRYVSDECEFWFPKGLRQASENLKQGSLNEFVENSDELLEDIKNAAHRDLNLYNKLLDKGVAPEVARQALPINLMTEVIWSGTLGAWMDMIKLRLGNGAQVEAKAVALTAYGHIQKYFPDSAEALLNAN